MRNPIKQFIKKAKGIALTPEERSRTDDQLLAFLRSVAAPEAQEVFVRRLELDRRTQQRSSMLLKNIFSSKTMPIFLAFVLFVTAGSGVSLAAQDALPGEALYPAKIALEEVHARLSLSTEAKSNVQTYRAGRRLEELEALAAKGKLDAEVKAKVEADFTAQAAKAKEGIITLQATDQNAAATIASDFEAALKTHESILVRMGTEKPTIWEKLNLVLGTVREETKAVVEAREGAEAKVSAQANTEIQAAAEGKKNAAAQKIDEVERTLARLDARIGAGTRAAAETRLEAAMDAFAQGNARLEAGAFNEAFLAFSQAHRLAQEAKLLIKTGAALNLDGDQRIETKTEGRIENKDREDKEDSDAGLELKGNLKTKTDIEVGF